MFQLAQRLGLDLADALAGHRELLADFFQRVVGVHADAEAHAEHAFLTRGERGEHARRGLAQVGLDGRVNRQDRVLVLDEIAEMRILLVADRSLQRQRLLGDLEHLAHFLERHAEFFRQFLRRRLAADLVEHLPRGAHDFVDGLDHVHRNADGARLVGDRAGDGLANPPGRVSRELVAAAVFEFIDRLHQADIAFLDQIEELQAAVGVFLGDGNDEAEIGLDHFLLGLAPFCTMCTILRNSPISRPVSVASVWMWVRNSLMRSLSRATKVFQPFSESYEMRLSQRGSSSEPWYCRKKLSRATPWLSPSRIRRPSWLTSRLLMS